MNEKRLYKLTPSLHANIWGGNRLREYGKVSEADRIGESWELSFVKGNEAYADGVPISELLTKESFGTRAASFEFFPVLTKFIDAKEKLSVQVHPGDEYALANEGMYGKSEMWYVVDAEEGAGLYMGFRRHVDGEELRGAIESGTVESLLSFKPVKAGDVFFIPAGTVHAIGGGVLIYEIQQNSTLTYRLYDYMRRDSTGGLRELHVEKALSVLSPEPYSPMSFEGEGVIGRCEYFTTVLHKSADMPRTVTVDGGSFVSLTAVSGEGTLTYTEKNGKSTKIHLTRGDTYLAPASKCAFGITLSGDMTVIEVRV